MKPYRLYRRASSVLDIQTVTNATSGVSPNRVIGFAVSPAIAPIPLGSISDGTSNIYAGAAIFELRWEELGGAAAENTFLSIAGTLANSGWTTMIVGGTSYVRSAATFQAVTGGSGWSWNAAPFATQPFTGATTTVTFT